MLCGKFSVHQPFEARIGFFHLDVIDTDTSSPRMESMAPRGMNGSDRSEFSYGLSFGFYGCFLLR